MNSRDNKLEIAIAALAFVAVFGMFKFFGSFDSNAKIESQEISYEMPRPKNDLVGEFGLNGREIDRRYVNPFDKKKAEAAKKTAVKPAQQVVKKAPAQKTAKNDKSKAPTRPKTTVNVVDRNAKKGLSQDPALGGGPESLMLYQNNVGGEPAEKKDKADVLSPAQWRALLSAQPTRENMDKLLKALNANEVDANTFYMIVEEMLKSQKAEDQTTAMYGLQRTPTYRSFALVASNLDTLPTSIQTSAQQYLSSFSDPSRHGVLMQALQGSDIDVALQAATVVREGLESAQNGGSTDPREVRGGNHMSSINVYSRFAPIFNQWAQSGDPALQNMASSILPLLPVNQASL